MSSQQTDVTLTPAAFGAWPCAHWGDARVEHLRSQVGRFSGDPLGKHVAEARLAIASCDLAGARIALADLRQAVPYNDIPPGYLRQILALTILAREVDAANDLLKVAAPYPGPIGFEILPSLPEAVSELQVADGSVVFRLPVTLFSNQAGEHFLQRWFDIYPILAYYLSSQFRTEGKLAISLGDAGDFPGITFCDNRSGYFLIPDSIFMDSRGYTRLRQYYSDHAIPWSERVPKAFWRGATSGQPLNSKQGWRSLPRVLLCELNARHADLMDAGITSVVQIEDSRASAWLNANQMLKPHVPPEEFQSYKYQIDIDGNTTSWPGLFIKLLSGSPVLKVAPRAGLQQWYYGRLKPWVNFVPVAPDLSDLIEKIQWLREHDDAAQAIGVAGRKLAEDLTYEHEIVAAGPTIAAAMRDASGLPILYCLPGHRGGNVDYLAGGWHVPDEEGVVGAEFQSSIRLPRLQGLGGKILWLEISPAIRVPQRLIAVVNGDVVGQRVVQSRTTWCIPLSQSLNEAADTIAITLMQPDACLAASDAHPGDSRRMGIRLHRMEVFGSSGALKSGDPQLIEAAVELGGKFDASAEDISSEPPLGFLNAELRPLRTFHGTRAYVDLAQKTLRHGKEGTVPENLFVAALNDPGSASVCLIRVAPSGARKAVAVRPRGRLSDEAQRAELNSAGLAEQFELLSQNGGFALRGAGMLLCAEPSGELELTRVNVGNWEIFSSR